MALRTARSGDDLKRVIFSPWYHSVPWMQYELLASIEMSVKLTIVLVAFNF